MNIKDLYLAVKKNKSLVYKDKIVFDWVKIRRGKILCSSYVNIETRCEKRIDTEAHRPFLEICSIEDFLKHGRIADGYEIGVAYGIEKHILENTKSEILY